MLVHRVYRVRVPVEAGDTIESLSEATGVPSQALIMANGGEFCTIADIQSGMNRHILKDMSSQALIMSEATGVPCQTLILANGSEFRTTTDMRSGVHRHILIVLTCAYHARSNRCSFSGTHCGKWLCKFCSLYFLQCVHIVTKAGVC